MVLLAPPARVADDVWISLGVPVAVLVATLLLQRLEATLLNTPERAENSDHPAPSESLPLLTTGPLEPPPPRHEPEHPALRGAA
ncbi:hypothetical protein [Pseudonocardia adelaidensis]|uniref:Uncharacterized protein n=1 Tax=Pseudonocardia adelaidensis TaxID=648754 RepID=A0ABP9P2J4_9PSEU